MNAQDCDAPASKCARAIEGGGATTDDTIVAVSTPLGASARAICRLSGPAAIEMAARLFEPAADSALAGGGGYLVPFPSRRKRCQVPLHTYVAVEGAVRLALRRGGPASRVPATLYVMRAPRSYTREDVAELHLPGSIPVVAAVVAALVEGGARPAGPGEFTRRAFLNGRIDLAQAEAVLGVIRAAGDEELRSALAGLGAASSRRVEAVARALEQAAALVELGIDFSEEDLEPVPPARIAETLESAVRDLADLAASPAAARVFDSRAAVALVGPPNSGKSSLFNALVGHDRSIVSHVPGTTRDVVTAPLAIGPWRLTLADTAGAPEGALACGAPVAARAKTCGTGPLERGGGSPCSQPVSFCAPVDQQPVPHHPRGQGGETSTPAGGCATLADDGGVAAAAWAAARQQAGASHLLVLVLDRSRPFRADVLTVLEEVVSVAPLVVALNKSDLPARTTPQEVARWRPGVLVAETSAVTGGGLDDLRAAVAGAFASARVRVGAEGMLVPARQARAAAEALVALRRALELARQGDRPELAALEIRAARDALACITGRGLAGRADPEGVLDLIFSQFCVGK